jgi:hypothetical protein
MRIAIGADAEVATAGETTAGVAATAGAGGVTAGVFLVQQQPVRKTRAEIIAPKRMMRLGFMRREC